MGRPRKTHVSEGKANIIKQLMKEYDIETPQDIQVALRDLLGPTIQNILESEIENQMENAQEEEPAYSNSRNGYKPKTLKKIMAKCRSKYRRTGTVTLIRKLCHSINAC